MNSKRATNSRRRLSRALFGSGLWSAAFAMVFLGIGGCFAFESPIDGDPGEGGFD